MWHERIPSTMKKVRFQGLDVILREYDFDNDPKKLVIHLFNQMDSYEENLQSVLEGDKWFDDPHQFRKRLVAEIEGELIATVTIEKGLSSFTDHRYRLYAVVTAPQYRGTGLSQIFFDYIKEWIKGHRGSMILVETWENNISARKFYEKMGFIQYACLPGGFKNRNGDGYVDEILYFFQL